MTTSNYITFILLGVIGLVFLIDFILNSRKKPLEKSVEKFVEKEESLKENSNPLNWILNRKKNITLSLILIPILKVLTHSFLFPNLHKVYIETVKDSRFLEGYRTIFDKEPLGIGSHFEVMFTERVDLFIPVIIVFLIVVWFFNDKIKAR